MDRVEEIEELGLEEMIRPDTLMLIEWGGKAASLFGTDCYEIRIDFIGDEGREIKLKGPEATGF